MPGLAEPGSGRSRTVVLHSSWTGIVLSSIGAVAALTAAIKSTNTDAVVVTSLVEPSPNGHQHVGVLVSKQGVVHRQPQLHRVQLLEVLE